MQHSEWATLYRLPLSVIKKVYTRLCSRQASAKVSKKELCRKVVSIGRSRGGYSKLIRAAVESKGRSLDPFFAVVRHLHALSKEELEAVTNGNVCTIANESRRDLVHRFLKHSLERVSWLTPERIEALSDSVEIAKNQANSRAHGRAESDLYWQQWFISDDRVGSIISRYDRCGLQTIHVITGFSPKRSCYTSRLLIAYYREGLHLSPTRPYRIVLRCPKHRPLNCCDQGWQSGKARLVIREQDCVTGDGYATLFEHYNFKNLPMHLRLYVLGFL